MSYLASGHFLESDEIRKTVQSHNSKIPDGIYPVDSTYGRVEHEAHRDPHGPVQARDNSCGASVNYDAASSHYINPEAYDNHEAHTQPKPSEPVAMNKEIVAAPVAMKVNPIPSEADKVKEHFYVVPSNW